MSTFLTWFLKEASVTELEMRILKFGEYYRTKISNTVFRIRGSIYSWNHKIV